MKTSRKGVSLIEVLVAASLLVITASAILALNSHMNSASSHTNADIDSLSLSNALTTILSDPTLCTASVSNKTPFYAAMANPQNGGYGYPLKITLPNQLVIDGSQDTVIKAYGTEVVAIGFRTEGPAKPIFGLKDPLVTVGTSQIYSGDVYLVTKSLTDNTSAQELKTTLVATILLTIDSTNRIFRCYAPVPCKQINGSFNPKNKPSCNICPVEGDTWVGNTPVTGSGEGGDPICIPHCPDNQVLVSDGSGIRAYCIAPKGLGCTADNELQKKTLGDCCTQRGSIFNSQTTCGNQLPTHPNPKPLGIWGCAGDATLFPLENRAPCTKDGFVQYYGCTIADSGECTTSCQCQ